MAAGIMRRIYEQEGISGLVESAGTADWNVGHSADHRSIKVSAEHGIDIKAHRARQVSINDFSRFDFIFALDHRNLKDLQKMVSPKLWHKIRLLDEDKDISDPYSGDTNTFRQAFETIEACCLKTVDQFRF